MAFYGIFKLLRITACAAATNSCISDEPCQWEGEILTPAAPNLSTDSFETPT